MAADFWMCWPKAASTKAKSRPGCPRQVLGALWDLLSGFAAADEATRGQILAGLVHSAEGRQHIYGGLLTVIMRLVFCCTPKTRACFPTIRSMRAAIPSAVCSSGCAKTPGAIPTPWISALAPMPGFCRPSDSSLMAADTGICTCRRHGQLFDPMPTRFGRSACGQPARHRRSHLGAARVRWGDLARARWALMLDGERLSYRALDVEQVGSVYESMMGFAVCALPGRALALRPKGVVIDLDALLAQPGAKRAAYLKEHAECDLPAAAAAALREATPSTRSSPRSVGGLPNRHRSRCRPEPCFAARRRASAFWITYTPARADRADCPDHARSRSGRRSATDPGRSRSSTLRSVIRRWARARFGGSPVASLRLRCVPRGKSTAACHNFRPMKSRTFWPAA